MKLSELVLTLSSNSHNGDDPEIQFESYEWTDDLEELQYLPRYFDEVCRCDDKIVIRTRGDLTKPLFHEE